MPSVTSICNQALSRLGANKIININDDTTEAGLCRAMYEVVRDNVIEEHQWSFAIKRYKLPKSSPDEANSQYSNKFLIPVEVINIILASSNPDDRIPNTTSWRVEGEYIVANADSMYVKAVTRVVDPNLYSPMFIQALTVRLAAELAYPITQNSSLGRNLLQEYARLLELAAQKDGQQGSTVRIRSSRYIAARASGGGGSYLGPYV